MSLALAFGVGVMYGQVMVQRSFVNSLQAVQGTAVNIINAFKSKGENEHAQVDDSGRSASDTSSNSVPDIQREEEAQQERADEFNGHAARQETSSEQS